MGLLLDDILVYTNFSAKPRIQLQTHALKQGNVGCKYMLQVKFDFRLTLI